MDAEKQDNSDVASGNIKWYSPLENSLEVSYKTEHAIVRQLYFNKDV